MKKYSTLLAVLLILCAALLIAFVLRQVEKEEHGESLPSSPTPKRQQEALGAMTPGIRIEKVPRRLMPEKDPSAPLSEEELRELKLRDFHEYLRYKNNLNGSSEQTKPDSAKQKTQAREKVAERMLQYLKREEPKSE